MANERSCNRCQRVIAHWPKKGTPHAHNCSHGLACKPRPATSPMSTSGQCARCRSERMVRVRAIRIANGFAPEPPLDAAGIEDTLRLAESLGHRVRRRHESGG